MGKESEKEGIYVKLIHFSVHLKLTQQINCTPIKKFFKNIVTQIRYTIFRVQCKRKMWDSCLKRKITLQGTKNVKLCPFTHGLSTSCGAFYSYLMSFFPKHRDPIRPTKDAPKHADVGLRAPSLPFPGLLDPQGHCTLRAGWERMRGSPSMLPILGPGSCVPRGGPGLPGSSRRPGIGSSHY